jgi:hypothetical protein
MFWLVDIYQDGNFVEVISPTFSPAIKPGTASNHLKVEFINVSYSTAISVNGIQLYTRYGASIPPSKYGIGIIPYEGVSSLDASFDNFKVYKLP